MNTTLVLICLFLLVIGIPFFYALGVQYGIRKGTRLERRKWELKYPPAPKEKR